MSALALMTTTKFHSKVEVPGGRCDVCHRELSSWWSLASLTTFKLNYCDECLQNNAEPLWLLAATIGNKYIGNIRSYHNGSYISYLEVLKIIEELGEE